jgi:hypothetical protein
MFPLYMLIVAYGLIVFVDSRVLVGVLAFVVAFSVLGGIRNAVDHRTQAGEVADVIKAEAKPGDVVAYCPDQVGPDVSRLLEAGPRLKQYAFPDGAPPQRVNWIDYIDRVNAADANAFAHRVAKQAGSDHTLWLVSSPGYHNVEGKCEAVAAELDKVRGSSRGRVSPNQNIFEFMGLIQYPPKRS